MRENFFGKEKAEKYGKQILDALSGRFSNPPLK